MLSQSTQVAEAKFAQERASLRQKEEEALTQALFCKKDAEEAKEKLADLSGKMAALDTTIVKSQEMFKVC